MRNVKDERWVVTTKWPATTSRNSPNFILLATPSTIEVRRDDRINRKVANATSTGTSQYSSLTNIKKVAS